MTEKGHLPTFGPSARYANASPPKVAHLLDRVRNAVATGQFLDTVHATGRQAQRQITRPEILHVLTHGWHERKKDVFDLRYHAWNYAIRGKTVDGRPLRITVSFEGEGLLIITAIALEE